MSKKLEKIIIVLICTLFGVFLLIQLVDIFLGNATQRDSGNTISLLVMIGTGLMFNKYKRNKR